MFDFRLRSTSAESDAQAPLTEIPRKLSLRSNHSTTPSQTVHDAEIGAYPADGNLAEPSLFRRPSGNFEGLAELGGATFAELLGRGDVRESVMLHTGAGHQSEVAQAGEEETILTLPGGHWGVSGPDALLLLQELHRARISTAQRRRRRIGYGAGVVSLLVFALNLWLWIATIVSIVRYGGKGRGVVRWVEFAFYFASLALTLVVISFLRTRRPSTLGLIAVVSTTFVSGLHVSLSIANFILTFVWKSQLSASEHPWDVDVSWTSLDNQGGTNGWKGWTIAAVVRFFIVIFVSFLWLGTVRLYNKAIHVPFVISPHALPSSELRALLSNHRAEIVALPSSVHPASSHHDSPDWLPSHLDRAQYMRASEASAAYSYVSRRMRSSSEAFDEVDAKATRSGAATWVSAKVWGGLGWLMGVQPYESTEAQNQENEKGEAAKENGRTGSTGGGTKTTDTSHPTPSSRPADLDFNDSPDSLSQHSPQPPSNFFNRFFSSKRLSTSSIASSAPLLPQTSDSVAPNERTTFDIAPPPLPPKDLDSGFHLHSATGSSGSTNGNLVYVRMSDGRLVRRLSTIASEGTESIRRSRSDLSGSFQTGDSGPDSFTTAQSEQRRGDGAEQEVLLDEEERRRF